MLQTILRRMLIAQAATAKGPCPEAFRGPVAITRNLGTMSAELPADTVSLKVT